MSKVSGGAALTAFVLVFLTICSVSAGAQTFPAKPVRLVVGFSAGGGTDVIARVISKKLAETWPQPVVVQNLAGADGAIAAELVAKSPPDGYTLLFVTNALTIAPFQRKLPYDPVTDLAPVTLAASTPQLLVVHPTLPVSNVKELVALAKARPGQLSYGSGGTGTVTFLGMELFKSMTETNLVHVPYKGSEPAVLDLVGGHIQVMFGAISTLVTHVRSGKARAIAMTSAQRWPGFLDLPTVSESLPGFDAETWYGVLAPARTPSAIVNTLQSDMARALQQPDVKAVITKSGFEVIGNKPEEFAQIIQRDLKRWGDLIRRLGPAAEAK